MNIIDINGQPKEVTNVQPDDNYPGFIKVTYPSKREANKSLTYWYPTEKFVQNNPKLKSVAQTDDIPEEVVGTVCSADEDSITDDTQYWDIDTFKGLSIWISRGLGEGQQRIIKGNTRVSVHINKPWEAIPDNTSQYVISPHVHSTTPLGNTLPQAEIDQVSQEETNSDENN